VSTAPSTLGKYHLIKKIAAGGMAEIYLARVSGLAGFEKLVVVKRILPQLSTQNQFIEMFLDEARIAATLQHPNIVQMYDIGAADGNYFIAMEYLHGEDVRSIMRRLRDRKESGLPLDHAVNIVIGVASGLHYAHEKTAFDGKQLGIVHRDVTPQNVIITFDGAVKLVDFGIAKASNRLGETRFGTLKGKIPYMSPEQCQGRPLDRRSDIYAVGIMLYELTTSSRLYRGESDYDIMKQIVEQPLIPPSVRKPDYSLELEKIVLRALAKDPEERYQTAQDMQADLEHFAREGRMMISPIALSAYLKGMFPERAAWRPDAGQSDAEISDKVASRPGAGRPGSELSIEISYDEDSQPSSELTSGATPSANGQLGSRPSQVVARRRPTRLIAAVLVGAAAITAAVYLWMRSRTGGETTKTAAAGPPAAGAVADAAVPVVSPPDAAPAAAAADAAIAAPPPDAAPAVEPPENGHGKKPGKKPRDHKPDRKPPDPAGPPGELRVVANPSCVLIVDGKSRGETPVAGISLPPGKHTLQLVNPRFGIDKRYTVTITSGEVLKRSYNFPTGP